MLTYLNKFCHRLAIRDHKQYSNVIEKSRKITSMKDTLPLFIRKAILTKRLATNRITTSSPSVIFTERTAVVSKDGDLNSNLKHTSQHQAQRKLSYTIRMFKAVLQSIRRTVISNTKHVFSISKDETFHSNFHQLPLNSSLATALVEMWHWNIRQSLKGYLVNTFLLSKHKHL